MTTFVAFCIQIHIASSLSENSTSGSSLGATCCSFRCLRVFSAGREAMCSTAIAVSSLTACKGCAASPVAVPDASTPLLANWRRCHVRQSECVPSIMMRHHHVSVIVIDVLQWHWFRLSVNVGDRSTSYIFDHGIGLSLWCARPPRTRKKKNAKVEAKM